MTTEPRAAQCCCCSARRTLIVWQCVCIILWAFRAIYSIPKIFDHTYQTYLLCYRVWAFVELILNILLLYGAVKRQPRILMAGFIYETIVTVLVGILCLLATIIPSVFTKFFTDRVNMSMSSAMNSGQGSSISSQQQQQIEEMSTDPLINVIVTSMVLLIIFALQSMICYLYLIVYREAKRFQDNQVMVCAAGVVVEQGNYPNCPSYPASNYPPCETKTPIA
ncbi:hypothetical protein WR25_26227 [Diploscapter pachys]|uniref:Uncharacterized protein n=1 Tax=Diploscapter pachys TaxID=2018661 RepID=A0A2A2L2W5_9BILA|nr:hypothetical protein WR25_26227 [Diploscapter pachys]